ncbi:putative PIF1-like helicase-containing protein 1 [Homarus americanus]|uniref:Putative PIF1-like helicase-containing protein 1 n=1 Tax=Homarus americanus TaxID=6706 RepID=A0A8J5JX87_HOMAM|nr:putative PIF1-like helicase-containing protein 1 [Homarus americanus]
MVYPNIIHHYKDQKWLRERAILAPKNETVAEINMTLLRQLPGSENSFKSVDTVIDQAQAVQYPAEFLNSLEPTGMPPHHLTLKIGTPIMLLRILEPRNLCNGTGLPPPPQPPTHFFHLTPPSLSILPSCFTTHPNRLFKPAIPFSPSTHLLPLHLLTNLPLPPTNLSIPTPSSHTSPPTPPPPHLPHPHFSFSPHSPSTPSTHILPFHPLTSHTSHLHSPIYPSTLLLTYLPHPIHPPLTSPSPSTFHPFPPPTPPSTLPPPLLLPPPSTPSHSPLLTSTPHPPLHPTSHLSPLYPPTSTSHLHSPSSTTSPSPPHSPSTPSPSHFPSPPSTPSPTSLLPTFPIYPFTHFSSSPSPHHPPLTSHPTSPIYFLPHPHLPIYPSTHTNPLLTYISPIYPFTHLSFSSPPPSTPSTH